MTESNTDDDYMPLEIIFTLDVSLNEDLDTHPDPSTFVSEFVGKISCGRHEIGSITLVIFDLYEGEQAGWNAFDVIDSYDQDSADYGQIIFDEFGHLQLEVEKAFPIMYDVERVLILQHMEIVPEYRGKSIGLLAARRAVEMFGWKSFIIMKPFPLQFVCSDSPTWELPEGVTDKEKGCEAARRKLARYWKLLGAKDIGKTGYLGIQSSDFMPSIAKLQRAVSKRKQALSTQSSV